jgi:hypothetical protein
MSAINYIVDVLVPVYTLVVIGVLTLFYLHPRRPTGLVYTYSPINANSTKKDDGRDWREKLEGSWLQTDFDDLESWLIYCKKSFPVRILAPTVMKKIHNHFKFMDNYTKIHFRRDFSRGPTAFDVVLTLGDPEYVTIADDASSNNIKLKMYLDEDEKALVIVMLTAGSPDSVSSRRLLDDNTQENVILCSNII